MPKLLLIDNYDSFTYNLAQMFMVYDLDIHVRRCDMITIDQVRCLSPDYIVIGPGPGDPSGAGISISLIKASFQRIPILGVCLGMQCINEAFGGRTVRAPLPMHGKTSIVIHNNYGIFRGMPSPFTAARYHSLMIKPGDNDIFIRTSEAEDKVIMGISHPEFPLHGVQFHPESFLTEHGSLIIENFLEMGQRGKENTID